ncbi:response regulator [Ferruginibacter albus]|uniref:response regulator n=1 Tax=Ferruginibacter albus TaxID=2875540 RepID=UPI001CC39F27|nr:response regulator [Ferruginibacter albus]UAY52893.1 response regulator [Ferruginibacter albus]
MENSVLIVEDDKDIRLALELLLNRRGFNVLGVSDLTIENLSIQPDVILMDVYLSGKSGQDICKTIKENPATNHIPVIMMSASPAAEVSCMEAGANAFISKPFKISEVVSTVQRFIK